MTFEVTMELGFRPILFRRANNETDSIDKHQCELSAESISHAESASGREIREFYESVTSASVENQHNSEKPSGKRETRKRHEKRRTYSGLHKTRRTPNTKVENRSAGDFYNTSKKARVSVRCQNDFLKSAQDGDLQEMKKVLAANKLDVNVTDSFGWTALMCAAHAGRVQTINYLLQQGADATLRENSSGMTAVDIAKKFSQRKAAFALENGISGKRSDGNLSVPCDSTSSTSEVKHFCDICKSEFIESERDHATTTIHLFNLKIRPSETLYHIPESNRGFQMMLSGGWNKESGLGLHGTGRKFPVKTTLKPDRRGLGSKTVERPKVTHFGPKDKAAVKPQSKVRKMKESTLSRKKRQRQITKEQAWERKFRQYFNS